jgi:hypothetical protein
MVPDHLYRIINDIDERLSVIRCLSELSTPMDDAGEQFFRHLLTIVELIGEQVVAAETGMAELTNALRKEGCR